MAQTSIQFGGNTCDEQIERLRVILSREQCRSVTSDEAREVADGLLTFYEVLAEGRTG